VSVGATRPAARANTIRAAGRADRVAGARPHLADPAFTLKAAAWYEAANVHCPPQYFAGRDQLFRLAQRDRADLTELRLKARPKSHATTWKQAAEKRGRRTGFACSFRSAQLGDFRSAGR